MSAQVVRLRQDVCSEAPAPVPRVVLDQLHDLLQLDPIAGASAVRTLFVASEAGKARLASHLSPADTTLALSAPAVAVIGFDFLFAVSLILSRSSIADPDCARAVRTAQRSAALQGDTLRLAAAAVGLRATPIANFDAAGLRAEFFAGTEATVVSLSRLAPEASLIEVSAF
jgi:3-hydroxypropanoate dehydrogenase